MARGDYDSPEPSHGNAAFHNRVHRANRQAPAFDEQGIENPLVRKTAQVQGNEAHALGSLRAFLRTLVVSYEELPANHRWAGWDSNPRHGD
jgi:hypothetical protein